MSFHLLAGIMEINVQRGQEGLRAPAGQERAGIVFALTPGGSDKTSVGDAAISRREITDRKEAEGVV